MLKNFIVVGIATFAGWLLFFQILIPYAFDRPLFGMFRSRDRLDLENDIAEVKSEGDLYSLEQELEDQSRRNADLAREANRRIT